jgi:uncharacterized damage-inducible protein DinB
MRNTHSAGAGPFLEAFVFPRNATPAPMKTPTVEALFIEQAIYRLTEESLPRIRKCLAQIEEADLWYRPNEHVVSIGNLLVHLAGNVRQYIVSSLGRAPDVRERASEFSEGLRGTKQEVLARVTDVLEQAVAVLREVDTAELLRPRTIQGFSYTGLGAVFHVVEHFSYHIGQISLMVKLRKNIDLGYYAGLDLDVRNAPEGTAP